MTETIDTKERDERLTKWLDGKKVHCCTVDVGPEDVDTSCQFNDEGYGCGCAIAASMPEDSTPTDCSHWEERFIDGIQSFSTSNDIKLLTDKLGVKILHLNKWLCTDYGVDGFWPMWVDSDPTEQATKIDAFLREVGEYE